MNPTESNLMEVSEDFDTPQSVTSNNSLPMNPNPVEESESNVSSSNEKLRSNLLKLRGTNMKSMHVRSMEH